MTAHDDHSPNSRPPWHALLAPLPADAVPRRQPVASPGILATPAGAALAGAPWGWSLRKGKSRRGTRPERSPVPTTSVRSGSWCPSWYGVSRRDSSAGGVDGFICPGKRDLSS